MTSDQDMIVSEAGLVKSVPTEVYLAYEDRAKAIAERARNEAPVAIKNAILRFALEARLSALALRPKEAGQAGEPHVLCERAEERLCECGAAGSNEEHEDWCQWLGSEWHRWESALSAPASPAVTVGVKPALIEQWLIAAYARGVEWNEENPLDREYRFKAAGDWADKALNDPESELCRALTSPPGETAQVEAVAWPGRKFCETAERNVTELAKWVKGEDDKQVASDAGLALRTLLASPSLSAKESPEQLREAVIEAATLLLERLDDFESELDGDDTYREYGGHVAPAKSRLRAALKETGK